MHPELFLDPALDALLKRLAQVDTSKWQALRELGLDSPSKKGR